VVNETSDTIRHQTNFV